MRNYVAAAKHLAALQAGGVVRHIGVTNFDVPRLREMLDAGVRIVSNQVQVKSCPSSSCTGSLAIALAAL